MSDKVTFVSASVGGWHQPTGIVVVDRVLVPVGESYTYIPAPPPTPFRYRLRAPRPVELAETRQDVRVEYHTRSLLRFGPPSLIRRVGTSIGRILADPEMRDSLVLTVDATAIGAPGYRRIVEAAMKDIGHLSVLGVLVSGVSMGEAKTNDGLRVVPRQHLIAELQTMFDAGRFKIADALPLADTLQAELLGFQQKPPTKDPSSLDGWREAPQDDLVLAVGLACWAGERWLSQPDHVVLPEPDPFRSVGHA